MISNRPSFFSVIGVIILVSGCFGDVDHDNPLDADSDGFEAVGTISVSATRFYPPFEGLDGVEVQFSRLEDGRAAKLIRIDQTRGGGVLLASGLEEGRYEVLASLSGFSSSRDSVIVEIARVKSVNVALDGLPFATQQSVVAVHTSRWFPQPQDLFTLEIDVRMDDPDGTADIDSVWIEIPSTGLSLPLLPTPTLGRFAETISENRLSPFLLQQLLGLDVHIRAVDQAGFDNLIEPRRLVRVIDETPIAISPQGETLLSTSTPQLVWEAARVPFGFTYRIDVVREEVNVQVTVETQQDVSSLASSAVVSTPLTPGNYYWTISIVDTFGNRSRSKEAGFRIQ